MSRETRSEAVGPIYREYRAGGCDSRNAIVREYLPSHKRRANLRNRMPRINGVLFFDYHFLWIFMPES